MKRRWRRRAGNLAVTIATVFVMLGLAEIAVRMFPVIENADWSAVDAGHPVVRHIPDTTVTWSRDWDFALAMRRHSNNDGFLNDQDYTAEGPRPLLAVIGDSFIEALMVSYGETVYGRLSEVLGADGRVYSFGISSAPLSQYLAFAAHARDAYAPDAMVFVIIANDFDESFYRYKRNPAFHYFAETATSEEPHLVRIDYRPPWLRRAILSSALARYLYHNLRLAVSLGALRSMMREGEGPPTDIVGNVPRHLPSERVAAAERAVELFLAALPQASGLPKSRILFLVDGIRPSLYDDAELAAAGDSYWAHMRDRFLAQAAAAGYETIDMQPVFRARHARTGERFEFERDNHWNGIGHAAAAAALRGSRLFRTLYPAYVN